MTDTLDMVFIDHWKDRLPAGHSLLEVSLCLLPRSGPQRRQGAGAGLCAVGTRAWGPGLGRVGLREHRWMACICGEQQMPPGSGRSAAQSCPGRDLRTVLTRLLCP